MHHAERSSLGTTEEDMAPAMAAFAAYADDLSAVRRKGEAAVALRRAIDVTSGPAIVAYPGKRLPWANI
jgi:hypothetical protein